MTLGASVGADTTGASGTGVGTIGTALFGALAGLKIGELIDNFDLGKAL
jgi:hypothetical protein